MPEPSEEAIQLVVVVVVEMIVEVESFLSMPPYGRTRIFVGHVIVPSHWSGITNSKTQTARLHIQVHFVV